MSSTVQTTRGFRDRNMVGGSVWLSSQAKENRISSIKFRWNSDAEGCCGAFRRGSSTREHWCQNSADGLHAGKPSAFRGARGNATSVSRCPEQRRPMRQNHVRPRLGPALCQGRIVDVALLLAGIECRLIRGVERGFALIAQREIWIGQKWHTECDQ